MSPTTAVSSVNFTMWLVSELCSRRSAVYSRGLRTHPGGEHTEVRLPGLIIMTIATTFWTAGILFLFITCFLFSVLVRDVFI